MCNIYLQPSRQENVMEGTDVMNIDDMDAIVKHLIMMMQKL